ncbi:MAG: hypothetical protein R6U78_05645, partial [Bacteroidales bacterium]
MKTITRIIPVVLAWMTVQSCHRTDKMEPPIAEKRPRELTIHGHTRIDPYYWLRERGNPEVIAYLEAENAYREAMMKDEEKLREELFEEMVGRIRQD